MNNDKKLQAKNLYFQTELTKTQIANLLNISRRSLHYWIKEGNWDRLKQSAANLPAILVENCYHIMGQLTRSYLSERRMTNPITYKDADMLHKLMLTIGKLKGRSSLNDTMEMFAFFLDGLKKQNPKLAAELAPYVDNFVSSRADVYMGDMLPEGMSPSGYLPFDEPTNPEEDRLDDKDFFDWENERLNTLNSTFEGACHDSSGDKENVEATPGSTSFPAAATPGLSESPHEAVIFDIRSFAEKSTGQQSENTSPFDTSVNTPPALRTVSAHSDDADPFLAGDYLGDRPIDPATLPDPFENIDMTAGLDYLETVLSKLSLSKERIAEVRNICATVRKE